MLPLMRTRSRHDCSFVPGTPFLAGATTFAMVTVLVSVCLFVRHKRRHLMKVDVNTDVYGTYYEGRVEYSTVEVC